MSIPKEVFYVHRRKITQRIKEVKKIYKSCPVATEKRTFYYSGDRWLSLGFLECWLENESAVTTRLRRSLAEAHELAQNAAEPRKSELLPHLGDSILSVVPAKPATSFYEAVQSVHFYIFNMFGLYPLGRPDRYLLPYYERDIKNGRLTREFAQELVDNLCLGVSGYVFSRAACGFIVGGSDKNGELVENDLTYMFLTALHHIRMPDPNGALAVNSKTSKEILSYAADILGEGTTHPAIYNDEAIIKGLLSYGIPLADACDYIHTTCAEISICAKSRMYTTSVTVNMPQVLLELFERQLPASYKEIEDLYFDRVAEYVTNGNRLYLKKSSNHAATAINLCAPSALWTIVSKKVPIIRMLAMNFYHTW